MDTIRHALLVASFGVCVAPSNARAQESGALKGVVTTTEKKPVPLARVRIVGTLMATLADTDGTFRMGRLPEGGQSVEVRMMGYTSVLVPVQIEAGRTADLQVILTAIALPLVTVEVVGDTLIVPQMQGFTERRSRGAGRFFTRAEIEKMQPRLFTDVLRRVPGIQIGMSNGSVTSGNAVRSARNTGTMGGRQCPVLYYMNGAPFPVTTDIAINNYISPEEVEAIEVYSGTSEIPSQFNSSMYNARCGVVVVWTLNGKDSRKKSN
jgi:hypothetical protein